MLRKSKFINNSTNINDYGVSYPIGLLMYYNNFFYPQKQMQLKNLKLIKNSPTKQQENLIKNIPTETQNNPTNNSTLIKLFNDNAL
jgi:hypothetical protein